MMKTLRIVLSLAVLSGGLSLYGEFDKKELKQLGEAEIAGCRDDTFKDRDTREKYEILEVNTFQNIDLTEGYTYVLHVAVEVTDKSKDTYLAELKGIQPDISSDIDISEYLGQDYWKLYMKHGDLERLSVTGYAVQFGVMDEEQFVLLDEEYDDVDSIEELKERTTNAFPNNVFMRHYYMYEEAEEGEMESTERPVKTIK